VDETLQLVAAVNALETLDESKMKKKVDEQIDTLLAEFHAIGHFGSNSMYWQI
jgi:tRNA(Phe) wybutosine-synthesizing methylase Tyw3